MIDDHLLIAGLLVDFSVAFVRDLLLSARVTFDRGVRGDVAHAVLLLRLLRDKVARFRIKEAWKRQLLEGVRALI